MPDTKPLVQIKNINKFYGKTTWSKTCPSMYRRASS